MSAGVLGKLGRSAAVAGVVALSSFTMVWNSGPAAALEVSPTVYKIWAGAARVVTGVSSIFGEGVVAAAPEVGLAGEGVFAGSAAVCATGVGCAALAVASVGIGLYTTRDIWVPWVANAFGQGQAALPGAAVCGSQMCGTFVSMPGVDPNGFSIDETLYPSWRDHAAFEFSLVQDCVDANGSNLGHENGIPYRQDLVGSGQWVSYGWLQTPRREVFPGCNAGRHLTGVLLNGDYYGTGVGPVLKWGTLSGGFDPSSRANQARVECTRPDGTQYQVSGAVTAPGPLPADGLMVQLPTCQNGDTANAGAHGTCVTLLAGLPGAMVDQSRSCVTPSAASAAAYPNCVGATACSYVIRVDGIACTVGRADCVDWSRVQSVSPSRVTCRYGPYTVDLGKCAFMERAYELTGAPATGPNTDGNPRTWTGPGPNGQPSQATDPAPQTQPPPSDLPAPGTSNIPTPENSDCWPSGWASLMNPSSWVLQPIKCAMVWAFVPSTAVQTNAVTDQLDRAGIAPSIAALTTAVSSLGGSEGGCEGPAISFDVETVHQSLHPFAACTAPMSTVAGYSYAFVSVVVVIGGAGKIISLIAHGFGYGGPPPTWQQGTLF